MLKVHNLCKSYPGFELKDISFTLEKGYILGFIGANGAGKTTTIKCMLNIAHKDKGKVEFFSKDIDEYEESIKQQVGFMMGAPDYYPKTRVNKITKIYSSFFNEWNNELFESYMQRFKIDPNKRLSELSTGMKVKFAIALALSHNAKLIICDEPTSGLDPVARKELLTLFQEIVEDGEHSILFSTHITSDLDKCADYIIFIKEGKLIANTSKDDLIDKHVLIAGKNDRLTEEIKSKLIGYTPNRFGFTALALRENLTDTQDFESEVPNIEDIMVYYLQEEA